MSNFADEQEKKQLDVKLEKLANIINNANEKLGVDDRWHICFGEELGITTDIKKPSVYNRARNEVFMDLLGNGFGKATDKTGLYLEGTCVNLDGESADKLLVKNKDLLDETIMKFEKNYEPSLKTAIQEHKARIAAKANQGR